MNYLLNYLKHNLLNIVEHSEDDHRLSFKKIYYYAVASIRDNPNKTSTE